MVLPGSSALPAMPSSPGFGFVIAMLYADRGRSGSASRRRSKFLAYTPVARTAMFHISSRSKVNDHSSDFGCGSFGLGMVLVTPAIERKSDPFRSRFTPPAWYCLLLFSSCHVHVVFCVLFVATGVSSGCRSRRFA